MSKTPAADTDAGDRCPPVLLVIFNRPEHAAETFARIRSARPRRLFVHADGPRPERPDDAERCRLARAATETVDWECEVLRLYRDENLGCGPAVSSALDWFFGQVEEGIVLEDDCRPLPAFFGYCRTMLERYRDRTEVMHVSGCGPAPEVLGLPEQLDAAFLLPFPFIWGWASWRRAWSRYRFGLPDARVVAAEVKRYNRPLVLRRYWEDKLARTRTREINTWDYQWVLTLWRHQGLAVTPSVCLVENLGFGDDSTHTRSTVAGFARLLAQTESYAPSRSITPDPAAVMTGLGRSIFGQTQSAAGFLLERALTAIAPTRWLYYGLRRRFGSIAGNDRTS